MVNKHDLLDATGGHVRNEDEVAGLAETRWGVKFHRFGERAPLDWFSTRNGEIVGVAELKSRSHPSTQYPTVFLNVRKWLSLHLAAIGLGVTAVFLVRFTDGVKWIRVDRIPAGDVRMATSTVPIKPVRSDTEPVIHVPVTDMAWLRPIEPEDDL